MDQHGLKGKSGTNEGRYQKYMDLLRTHMLRREHLSRMIRPNWNNGKLERSLLPPNFLEGGTKACIATKENTATRWAFNYKTAPEGEVDVGQRAVGPVLAGSGSNKEGIGHHLTLLPPIKLYHILHLAVLKPLFSP